MRNFIVGGLGRCWNLHLIYTLLGKEVTHDQGPNSSVKKATPATMSPLPPERPLMGCRTGLQSYPHKSSHDRSFTAICSAVVRALTHADRIPPRLPDGRVLVDAATSQELVR